MTGALRGRDLLSVSDLNREEAEGVLELASQVKSSPEDYSSALKGKVMVMIFEKPSLRTRVTFETGMSNLGGKAIYLAPEQVRMGDREPVGDVARNLERWVQVVVARTFSHETLEILAREGGIPVINALSDYEHPCQAFADFQTVREYFGENRVPVTYVGDGNNVCHSLMLLGTLLGYEIRVACPEGFAPDAEITQMAADFASRSGGKLVIGKDPFELARGACVLYTDVWTSMGQEKEAQQRIAVFQGFQINMNLVKAASPDVKVMHCLPAHRGEEITEEVIDSPFSILFDQAENRLHSQKALLLEILSDE